MPELRALVATLVIILFYLATHQPRRTRIAGKHPKRLLKVDTRINTKTREKFSVNPLTKTLNTIPSLNLKRQETQFTLLLNARTRTRSWI